MRTRSLQRKAASVLQVAADFIVLVLNCLSVGVSTLHLLGDLLRALKCCRWAASDLAEKKQAASDALGELRDFHRNITRHMARELAVLQEHVDELTAAVADRTAQDEALVKGLAASAAVEAAADEALEQSKVRAAVALREMRQQLKGVTSSADGMLAAAHVQLADLTKCVEEEHMLLQAKLTAATGVCTCVWKVSIQACVVIADI